MKYQGPKNCNSVSIGGDTFNTDKKGQIEVPDTGDYDALLNPHGFRKVPEVDIVADHLEDQAKLTLNKK